VPLVVLKQAWKQFLYQALHKLHQKGSLAHEDLKSIPQIIWEAEELHVIRRLDEGKERPQKGVVIGQDLCPPDLFHPALQNIELRLVWEGLVQKFSILLSHIFHLPKTFTVELEEAVPLSECSPPCSHRSVISEIRLSL